MILYDATHTSHTRAQTGIQRVTRSLFAELEKTQSATGICLDPYQSAWRTLTSSELKHLHPRQPAARSRGSSWSLAQRLGGHSRRLLGRPPALPASTGLICPELFSAKVGARLPELFASVSGPRIAIFYDAIPLQYPELTPAGTVARFPGYMRELLRFDGIAAISETSATVLRDYWQWLGTDLPPPVKAIPLAIWPPTAAAPVLSRPSTTFPPRLLCVSTIEGRKNHSALLAACEKLWQEGASFELHLIGLARPDTARVALEKIAALQQAGHPLRFTGAVSDEELRTAYGDCAFTVYPSLIEGFGLPVLESLQYGKPCICSAQGALGEVARDGGCVELESMDAASLADAIRKLLNHPEMLASLTQAAQTRCFKTWPEYTRELTDWMNTLPRRT